MRERKIGLQIFKGQGPRDVGRTPTTLELVEAPVLADEMIEVDELHLEGRWVENVLNRLERMKQEGGEGAPMAGAYLEQFNAALDGDVNRVALFKLIVAAELLFKRLGS